MTGVLASAVRMEQHPRLRPTAEPRHRQRVQHQVGRHPRLDRPADHLAVEQVDHDCQIQPALGGGDVGDVAGPDPIRGFRHKVAIQHIRCHRKAVPGVRRCLVTPLVPSPDAVLTHQALDARQADPVTTPTQLGMNASRAVGLPNLLMDRADQHQRLRVGQSLAVRRPTPCQARKPLGLTDRASHRTGNGKALRCFSIQAYFTAAPSRNMPSLFLEFHFPSRGARPGRATGTTPSARR